MMKMSSWYFGWFFVVNGVTAKVFFTYFGTSNCSRGWRGSYTEGRCCACMMGSSWFSPESLNCRKFLIVSCVLFSELLGQSGSVLDILERRRLRGGAHPEVSEPRARHVPQAAASGRARTGEGQLLVRADVRGCRSAVRSEPRARVRRHAEVPPVRRHLNVRHRPLLLMADGKSPTRSDYTAESRPMTSCPGWARVM